MKLYKLRPLSNLEHVLDIVVHERLYCAPFTDLNDPFEGVYLAVTHVPSIFFPSLGTTKRSAATVSDVSEPASRTRVCSLSASVGDVRQWSHYGDGHRGIAIEIDFTGHESDLRKVDYLRTLRSAH